VTKNTPQAEMFYSISVTLGFIQIVKPMAINHVLNIPNKKLTDITFNFTVTQSVEPNFKAIPHSLRTLCSNSLQCNRLSSSLHIPWGIKLFSPVFDN
jgi:hypothetical protein